MHATGVVPQEERFLGCCGTVYEIERGSDHFIYDRLHTLAREWASVFDRLLPNLAKPWIGRRIVFVRCEAVEHATRTKPRSELRSLRVIRVLRLLFGVEVIEVAKKFVEPVNRRQ